MKSIRILPCAMVVILVGGFLVGCSRGPTEEELKFAELQQQFTLIQEQYNTLTTIREDLAMQLSSVQEIEAVDERKRTDEQKAQLE